MENPTIVFSREVKITAVIKPCDNYPFKSIAELREALDQDPDYYIEDNQIYHDKNGNGDIETIARLQIYEEEDQLNQVLELYTE